MEADDIAARSQACTRDSCIGTSCSLVDTGATNILLDMSMIPSEAVGTKTTSVTLAIGQQQASVWRAEIFADGVKTTLMGMML
eukprot:4197443-Amphidinium_carterae.4